MKLFAIGMLALVCCIEDARAASSALLAMQEFNSCIGYARDNPTVVKQLGSTGAEPLDTLNSESDSLVFHTAEVIVRSTKSNVASGLQPVPTAIVDGTQMVQMSAPTVSNALSREPGIALVRDGMWETNVSIRGLSRNDVVTMIDNTRIETANDLCAALSLIDPFDIQRIEVIKGANSALAGTGAFGGVVNVITNAPSYSDQPQVGGESMVRYESVNHTNAEFLALQSESNDFKLRLSGEYRNAGNYETALGDVPNSQFNDFGISGTAGVKLFDTQSLDLTYQRFQAQNTGLPGGSTFSQTASAEYTLARRELYKAEYSIPGVTEIIPSLIFRASEQSIERDVQVIQPPILTLTPRAAHNTGMLQAEATIVPIPDGSIWTEGHFLTVGVEAWQRSLDSRRERYNSSTNTMSEEVPLPNSSFGSAGAYVQDEWQLIPQTTILVGGRYDFIRVHNDLTKDTLYVIDASGQKIIPANESVLWQENTSASASWSGNMGIRQRLLESLDASLLLSRSFRAPSLEERYQYLNNGGSVQVGNPYLEPEQSLSIDGGLRWHSVGLRLDADIYYNALKDLVSEVPGIFEGDSAYVAANIGKARMYGYELSLETDLVSHFIFGSTLSFVRGEDLIDHSNLPQIPPLRGTIFADYSLDKIGNLNAQFEADADQNLIAAGETRTAGYALVGGGFTSVPVSVSTTAITFSCGVDNLLNLVYMNHLSTARGEIKYEPGRNIYAAASVRF